MVLAIRNSQVEPVENWGAEKRVQSLEEHSGVEAQANCMQQLSSGAGSCRLSVVMLGRRYMLSHQAIITTAGRRVFLRYNHLELAGLMGYKMDNG